MVCTPQHSIDHLYHLITMCRTLSIREASVPLGFLHMRRCQCTSITATLFSGDIRLQPTLEKLGCAATVQPLRNQGRRLHEQAAWKHKKHSKESPLKSFFFGLCACVEDMTEFKLNVMPFTQFIINKHRICVNYKYRG